MKLRLREICQKLFGSNLAKQEFKFILSDDKARDFSIIQYFTNLPNQNYHPEFLLKIQISFTFLLEKAKVGLGIFLTNALDNSSE